MKSDDQGGYGVTRGDDNASAATATSNQRGANIKADTTAAARAAQDRRRGLPGASINADASSASSAAPASRPARRPHQRRRQQHEQRRADIKTCPAHSSAAPTRRPALPVPALRPVRRQNQGRCEASSASSAAPASRPTLGSHHGRRSLCISANAAPASRPAQRLQRLRHGRHCSRIKTARPHQERPPASRAPARINTARPASRPALRPHQHRPPRIKTSAAPASRPALRPHQDGRCADSASNSAPSSRYARRHRQRRRGASATSGAVQHQGDATPAVHERPQQGERGAILKHAEGLWREQRAPAPALKPAHYLDQGRHDP